MKATKISLLAAALSGLFLTPAAGSAQTLLAHRGAEVDGTLTATLSSKTAHSGDTFTLETKSGWFHKNPLPAGSIIEGHVEGVSPASPTHKAAMNIVIDDVKLPGGATAPLRARVISLKEFEPHKHLLRDTGVIVGSAVVGHIVAKKRGVKAGGLLGAAAGFALVSTMKSDIVVKRGTLVRLKTTDDVSESP